MNERNEEERRYIAETSPETPRTEVRSVTAFKTLRDGTVHHVWECRECETPNITKEGNKVECENCHHEFADARAADKDGGGVYDQKEAGELYGDWLPARMKREGITKIAFSLIEVWAKEGGSLLQQLSKKKTVNPEEEVEKAKAKKKELKEKGEWLIDDPE